MDLERLCWRLGTDDLLGLRKNLEASLEEALTRDPVRRQPCWTESLAVGSAGCDLPDQVQEYFSTYVPQFCKPPSKVKFFFDVYDVEEGVL